MRFVDPQKINIPQTWLDKAAQLQKELEAIPLLKDKLEHIDKNPIWQDVSLFTALSAVMNGKCWYSEAQDLMSDRDVDHFRPKKRAKGIDELERDGYWFLAYDWENYRFSSIYSNRLRKDKFIDDETAYGKGIYFPLKSGSVVATTKRQIIDERYYLIDPTKKSDASLISFNGFGKVVPNVPKTHLWEIERITVSIKYYHLNHKPLETARAKKWNACKLKIDKIKELCCLADRTNNDDFTIEFLKQELIEWAKDTELLSGVVIACLDKHNMSSILTI